MLRAVIFDFDGVITNSEPSHLAMFQKVLAERGVYLARDEYYEKYLGMDDKECFSTILRNRGIETDPETTNILVQKKTRYLMEYIKDHIFVFPGVVDLVGTIRDRYPLAIASGALRHEIEFILKHAGLSDSFDVIVSAEDVVHGKPDPEAFTKALRYLNTVNGSEIMPHECLVIEDSLAGIEAAHAAGMKCLAVANTYAPSRLVMADRVVSTLEGLSIEDLTVIMDDTEG